MPSLLITASHSGPNRADVLGRAWTRAVGNRSSVSFRVFRVFRGLNSAVDYAIGIDLGGSSIKTLAITAEGDALAKEIVEFDPGAQMDWANKIRRLLENIQERQHRPASWIGL